jgi:hypothetical protein
MSIVADLPDDFVGQVDPLPACTCRPEYAYRKDGTRIDRQRIDAFCPLHGKHYRREVASAFTRSFNKRRHFSNFILHLGPKRDDELASWAKGYVRDLIRNHFDKQCIIKCVLHPKEGDHHLHVGVASDVGLVTLSAIMSLKSPRGRKARLDLQKAWVDGYRKDERWNWSAYVLRVDETWRDDEKVRGRQRRSWRSRSDMGERIKAPTMQMLPEELPQTATPATLSMPATTTTPRVPVGMGYVLSPALRWLAKLWLRGWISAGSASRHRISPCVGVLIQDDLVGDGIPSSRPSPQARPPPPTARPPPKDTASGTRCLPNYLRRAITSGEDCTVAVVGRPNRFSTSARVDAMSKSSPTFTPLAVRG